MTILDHVGGNPLAFTATRTKHSPDDYELTVKWLKRAFHYFEQIGLPSLEPEQQVLYSEARIELIPLLERLDEATKTMWLPAFKDGQGALVLDAKVANKKWHKAMPEAKEPLPMLEIGLVYGVSDADLVKQASGNFFAIASEAVTKLSPILPDVVPAFELSPPESREFAEGTISSTDCPKNGASMRSSRRTRASRRTCWRYRSFPRPACGC